MDSQVQQQRYELVSTVGKGGMAEVFLGWMNSVGGLRRKVAIKRILPDLAQKQSALFEQMFVDEARLAFQLEHDNIVRVYDVGQSANTFFIVMEYVQGMDLKKIYESLASRGRMMPLDIAVYLTLQVASGLGYAHALSDDEGRPLGLVHNDISPPNILIGRYGEVKVADFGLSDARSNDVATPEGMVKGKFAYISPESTYDPTLVSHKSDIFAAGIVFWELLAGQRLFQKESDLETFQAVRACTPPDIRTVRKDVPPSVAAALHKALAKDPAHRYESAEEFYTTLFEAAVSHQLHPNRYALAKLIDELQESKWDSFIGDKVSQNQIADLQNEMEDMLPPGVAKHLKTFVTAATVAEDVEDNESMQGDDWLGDVFDSVGFDDAGEGLDFSNDHPDIGEPVGVESSPLDFESVPEMPPAPEPEPVRTSEPASPASAQSAPSTEQVVAALEEQFKQQKVMSLVWGAVGGLILGTLIGVAIGSLL